MLEKIESFFNRWTTNRVCRTSLFTTAIDLTLLNHKVVEWAHEALNASFESIQQLLILQAELISVGLCELGHQI